MAKSLDFLRRFLADRRDRAFLEASMAACALAVMADGEVSLSERYRVDALLERLERLNHYDPHKAIALMNRHIEDLRGDHDLARTNLLGRVESVAGDQEAALVIPRMAKAVMLSDGEITGAEKQELTAICEALGQSLDPKLLSEDI